MFSYLRVFWLQKAALLFVWLRNAQLTSLSSLSKVQPNSLRKPCLNSQDPSYLSFLKSYKSFMRYNWANSIFARRIWKIVPRTVEMKWDEYKDFRNCESWMNSKRRSTVRKRSQEIWRAHPITRIIRLSGAWTPNILSYIRVISTWGLRTCTLNVESLRAIWRRNQLVRSWHTRN